MSLAALIASASLLISGNSEPAKINYDTYQKPPIYAQASTGLANKDENLEKILSAYKNLILKPWVGKNAIKMALDFYNDIIKDKKEPYVAEAYFRSGYILCCLTNAKDVNEGLRRLDIAYETGDKEIKIGVLNFKFSMAINYEKSPGKPSNLRSPEHYVKEMEKLNPNSELIKALKDQLKRFRASKKPK